MENPNVTGWHLSKQAVLSDLTQADLCFGRVSTLLTLIKRAVVLEAGVLQKAGWQSSWAGWCFQLVVKGFSCQLLKAEEWFLEGEKFF